MSSCHRNLEPLARWHATIYLQLTTHLYSFDSVVQGCGHLFYDVVFNLNLVWKVSQIKLILGTRESFTGY